MSGMPKEMRLGHILQEWLNSNTGGELAQFDAELGTAEFQTEHVVNGQKYPVKMETDETTQWVGITIRTPWWTPESRFVDACRLANEINNRLPIGRIVANEGGPFEFSARFDLEGCVPSPMVITNLTRMADMALNRFGLAMARLAFTDLGIEDLLKVEQEPNVPDLDEMLADADDTLPPTL